MFSFEGFLRIESFLRSAYRLAYLNLLWLAATALGLVVFGIGPASYALARYVDRWLRFGETPPPTRTFLGYLREQPLRSMKVGWVLLAVGVVVVTNVFRAPNWYLQFLNVLALLVLLVAASYVFPLMSATDLSSVRRLLSTALLVGFGSLHWTILGATASAAVLWLLWQASPVLTLLFGVGVPALAVGLVTRSVFREVAADGRLRPTPDRATPAPRRRGVPLFLTTRPQTKGLAR